MGACHVDQFRRTSLAVHDMTRLAFQSAFVTLCDVNVLPVIDLMGGAVVRGVAGQRDEYRAVESVLAADARPETVATAFVEQFGFRDAYVADLDAIAGRPPALATYEALEAIGLRLTIDCGIGSVDDLIIGLGNPSRTVVVGLESLRSAATLSQLSSALGTGRGVFSLDMKQGRPLTGIDEWASLSPLSIADLAIEAGFSCLIALDLASVGVGGGPSVTDLCRQLRERYPKIELISGGGVRQAGDVRALCDAGCDRVLVASALHDGSLTVNQLQAIG